MNEPTGAASPLDRREFLRRSALATVPLLLGGCLDEPTAPRTLGSPRLSSRPGLATGSVEPGSTPIPGPFGVDGILYVPSTMTLPPALLVSLHGAGGSAESTVNVFKPFADEIRFALLAIDSAGSTWDAIMGGYSRDIAVMDRALAYTFANLTVPPERVFLEGFSDGASYALGVGLSNGDLFRKVMAFSPGFIPTITPVGSPPVFISHGTQDTVLPIDRTSRKIVPELREKGYAVEYEEFSGGHYISAAIATREFQEMMVR